MVVFGSTCLAENWGPRVHNKSFDLLASLGTQGGIYRASVHYLFNNIYFRNKYINIFKNN